MKRVLVTLFLGIVLFYSVSSVSAVQGVCTGTQTCYCSGRAVSCPCNADPCAICGPASPECTGDGGQNVQAGGGQIGNAGGGVQGEINTQNPQTFEDYVAVFGKGAGILADDMIRGMQNLFHFISSPFSKKSSWTKGMVYDVKGKVWRNSSGAGTQGMVYDVVGNVWRNSTAYKPA